MIGAILVYRLRPDHAKNRSGIPIFTCENRLCMMQFTFACCLGRSAMNSPRRIVVFLSTIGLAFLLAADQPPTEKERLEKWEKNIVEIEKRLTDKSLPRDAIFFAGSSTIVRWDLAKSFPDLPVVKVGFGGSQIRDSTHYAARILLPHRPQQIVFYAGDNDLNAKREPKQVLADFEAFVQLIHRELPKTKIAFLSIKPSPKRFALIDKQREANALVKKFCDADDRLRYLDIFTPMLDSSGKPRPELYDKDELHLSPDGYAVCNPIVRAAITK